MKNRMLPGIVFLITIVLVGGYFLVYLPQRNRSQNRDKISNEMNCAKQAQVTLMNFEKTGDFGSAAFQINHFNSKLNGCFLVIREPIQSWGGYVSMLVDAYEQRRLVTCLTESSPCLSFLPSSSETISSDAAHQIIHDYMTN
jgi:hypothetical protein